MSRYNTPRSKLTLENLGIPCILPLCEQWQTILLENLVHFFPYGHPYFRNEANIGKSEFLKKLLVLPWRHNRFYILASYRVGEVVLSV